MSYDETQKQDQADADEEAEERKVRFRLLTRRVINYFFLCKIRVGFYKGRRQNIQLIPIDSFNGFNVKTVCFYSLDIITLGPILNHTLVRMFTYTHFTYVKETF